MINNIKFCSTMVVLILTISLASASSDDILFQASTIGALMEGVMDGDMTFRELAEHGDFGLGTFDRLDGEMVELDGHFYQVRSDGLTYEVNESTKTPFAEVTYFSPDRTLIFNRSSNLTLLEDYLDGQIPSMNIFYAIRIDGTFDYVKTRSVPAQERPYPTLEEALKGQRVLESHNQSGTVVGFWAPAYAQGVNVPGYHFHFLNENRTRGGHLLDLRLQNAKITVDYTEQLFLALPQSDDFLSAQLGTNGEGVLEKA